MPVTLVSPAPALDHFGCRGLIDGFDRAALEFLSAEAALALLAMAGVRTVRSPGVDGAARATPASSPTSPTRRCSPIAGFNGRTSTPRCSPKSASL
jgi:hypothetical protein